MTDVLKPPSSATRLCGMRVVVLVIVLLVRSATSSANAQAPLFEFNSAFWINLHHYLHALGRAGQPLTESLPAAAARPERDAWDTAIATYRERYGKRSLLFDDELVGVKLALAAAGDETLDTGALPASLHAALTAAAPIYRRLVWPEHDAANRRTIAAARQLVGQHGAAIASRLAASYGARWPSTPIRVDFVHDAGPPGNAYTFSEPTQVTIAAVDSRHGGLSLLEVLFHEASHRWDATLMTEVDAAAMQQNTRVARDLWHALLFFNAGTITADTLRAAGIRDYEMYADKQRLFTGRWVGWREPIATYWTAFLAGAMTRQDAVARIVREIAPARPRTLGEAADPGRGAVAAWGLRRLDDAAVEEVNVPPRQVEPPFVVRDHADRGAVAVQLAKHLHQRLAALRVEIARGLIGEQDRRAPRDGAGNGHQLLVPTRE
jgi:hypothetical protein